MRGVKNIGEIIRTRIKILTSSNTTYYTMVVKENHSSIYNLSGSSEQRCLDKYMRQ